MFPVVHVYCCDITIIFIILELEFGSRALHMLGKHSIIPSPTSTESFFLVCISDELFLDCSFIDLQVLLWLAKNYSAVVLIHQ